MLITDTAAMEWERLRVSSRNMRTSRKLLREGEALPGMGLYALLVKLHDGAEKFTTPRHRHNFAQLRIGLRAKRAPRRALTASGRSGSTCTGGPRSSGSRATAHPS